MPRYKFDDCADCRYRRKPDICRECDYGELFEDNEVRELDFSQDPFVRASKQLVTDDDEPGFNPDDLLDDLDQNDEEDDQDDYDEE